MPASRLIASALASAYPTRANTAAAASKQPLALHPEPDVERRRVAAAGDGHGLARVGHPREW